MDHEETQALTTMLITIKSVLATATHFCWKLQQMDLNSDFFKGNLEVEAYIYQWHSKLHLVLISIL